MTFHWSVLFTQVAGFLVLLLILRKFLWGRLLGFLDARREEIRRLVEETDGHLAAAKASRGEVEARLAKVESECETRLNEAVRKAEQEVQQILVAGRARAEEDRQKFLKSLDEEHRKVRNQLKDEIVRLSVAVSEQLLARAVSEAEASRIADEVIAEIQGGVGARR